MSMKRIASLGTKSKILIGISKNLFLITFFACFCGFYSVASDEAQKPKSESEISARLDQLSLKSSPDHFMYVSGTQQVEEKSVHQLFIAYRTTIDITHTKIAPVLKEKAITLKGSVDNPLWNKKIKHFCPLSRACVLIVLEEEPEGIYCLLHTTEANHVTKLDAIKTEQKHDCQQIISMTPLNATHVCVLAQEKNDSPFGRDGTGITIIKVDQKNEKVTIEKKEEEKPFLLLQQMTQGQIDTKKAKITEENSDQFDCVAEWQDSPISDETHPFFFDLGKHSQLLGQSATFETLTPGIGLYKDPLSGNVLLAMHGKTGSTNVGIAQTTLAFRLHEHTEQKKSEKEESAEATKAVSGGAAKSETVTEQSTSAKAAAGQGEEKKEPPIIHRQLLVRSVCANIQTGQDEQNNYILATNQTGDFIKNDQVIPMRTSTQYIYFITRSESADGKQNMFMVPGIISGNNVFSLAHKAKPLNKGKPRRKSARVPISIFDAKTGSDIPTAKEREYQINTDDLPGTVTHIETLGDCIFVSTADEKAGGIFVTRALFASDGRVAGWTMWKRVNGITAPVKHFSLETFGQKSIFYVTSQEEKDMVHMSVLDIIPTLNKEYALNLFEGQEGVRIIENLFTGSSGVPDCSAGVNWGQTEKPDNIVAFVGKSELTLVNAGQGTEPLHTILSSNQHSISISMQALTTIGSIRSVCLVHDPVKTQSWLTLSGDRGLAFLCNPDGEGIPSNASGAEFLAYAKQQEFVTFTSDFHIKKIVAAHGALFILSDRQLYRVDWEGAQKKTLLESAVSIFEKSDLLLFDVAICGPLIALATSEGLLRNGDHTSASRIGVDQLANWVSVELPYQIKPTVKLHLVAQNSAHLDMAQHGMLYVVSSFRGQHKTTIHRLAIGLSDEVESDTLLPVDDAQYLDVRPFFVTHTYQDQIFVDGLHHYCVFKNKIGSGLATLEGGKYIPYALEKDEPLHTIACCQATGQYIVSGKNNLYISK